MRDLKGKVAVVTGAASGIGRAMVERFAREGMKLVLADVEEGPLAQAREELARGGAEVLAVKTDVSKRESVDELARKTFETFGTAHVVCNNAGVGSTAGAAWDLSQGDWEWTMGVNLWGVIHGVRAFVPRLVQQGEGHVVNTASIAGMITVPGMSPYCVTKHAVVALSECMYHDLSLSTGGKVGVSVLCPAWVKTRINQSERNRPASTQTAKGPLTPQQEAIQGAVHAAVEHGIPAEVVAEKVHSAIVDGRFYILTHSKTKRLIEHRMKDILEGTNPQYDPVAG